MFLRSYFGLYLAYFMIKNISDNVLLNILELEIWAAAAAPAAP